MYSNGSYSRTKIENILQNMQDKTAASTLQRLLEDMNHLENQVRRQNERMASFHMNMRQVTADITQKIMQMPDKTSSLNN